MSELDFPEILKLHNDNVKYLNDLSEFSSIQGVREHLEAYEKFLAGKTETIDLDAIDAFLKEEGADGLPNPDAAFNEALGGIIEHLPTLEDCVATDVDISQGVAPSHCIEAAPKASAQHNR